jgi:hypothetical protein
MLLHRCSKSSGYTAGTKTSFRRFALVLAILLIGVHTFGEIFHCKLHGGWAIAVDSPSSELQGITFTAPTPAVATVHDDCGFCALNGLVGILCGASVALALALVAVAASRGICHFRTVNRIPRRFPARAPPVLV